ncbi:MAG: hypothetical protein QM755_06485 [Luteolibacter sp.]
MKSFTAILAIMGMASPTFAEDAKTQAPKVVVDSADTGIFPDVWLKPPILAKAGLLETGEQERARKILSQALAKYPPTLLAANLTRVHALGSLEYSGVATGGTNSRKVVYVVAKGRYSSWVIEKNFHAEFSSILLRNFPQHLDKVAWEKINPPDFHYGGSGVQAVREGQASNRFDETLNAAGFLHPYGTASPEEDFNSFASRLLMGDEALWKVLERYPKTMAKAELVMAFYGKLDPVFTREHFLSLRKPVAQ